jgi:hypothetical protein
MAVLQIPRLSSVGWRPILPRREEIHLERRFPMTAQTLAAPAHPWLAAISDALFALSERSEIARRAKLAERLYAMTDDELAAIGLTRGEVLRHAFGPYLHL